MVVLLWSGNDLVIQSLQFLALGSGLWSLPPSFTFSKCHLIPALTLVSRPTVHGLHLQAPSLPSPSRRERGFDEFWVLSFEVWGLWVEVMIMDSGLVCCADDDAWQIHGRHDGWWCATTYNFLSSGIIRCWWLEGRKEGGRAVLLCWCGGLFRLQKPSRGGGCAFSRDVLLRVMLF